jgi:hypothetical protein
MAILAVALVRGTTVPDGLSADVLDDAALVRTSIRFDLEPDDLATALAARLADAFGDDPRGLFVVPDVALAEARAHRTHAAVVDAIGEAGMWVRRPSPIETMEDRALGADDLLAQALAGHPISPSALIALLGGSDDVDATDMDAEDDVNATATDAPVDFEALLASPALRGVIERLAGTIASSPDAQRELEGAAASGMDLEALAQSPAIAQLVQGLAQELGNNPAALAALLGGGVPSDDDE